MPPFRSSLFKFILFITATTIALTGCGQEEPEVVATDEPVTVFTPTPEPTLTPFPTPAGPTATPAATLEPTPTGIPAWYTGVFADVPSGLGQLSESNQIEAQLDPNLPAVDRFPAHDLYLLTDWPITDLIEQPRILAFPARDYASINVHAQSEIEALKQLLSEPEQIESRTNLPFLPVKSSPQAFTTLAQQLPSRNGDGIRYVTWYPTQTESNQSVELVYTWQGLTQNGRGVVSAVFPISAPDLPPPPNTGSLTDFELWTAEVKSIIEQLPDSSFTPSLQELDQLASSIFAQLPEPELLFDTNGKVDLTIVYPRNGGQTIIGQSLEIEGYLQPGSEQPVELLLLNGDKTIAAQTVVSSLDGWFQTSLSIPINIQGNVELVAISDNQTTDVAISLVENPNALSQSITLDRPTSSQVAVANYFLFFEGSLNTKLVDDTLTFGLAIDNCQTVVAKQSLTLLPEDSFWHGTLQVPNGISGPACAIAWTGTYGEPDWREIQVPLEVLAEAPSTPEIIVGNPQNSPLFPGQISTIYGTATRPANSQILVTAFTKDESFNADYSVSVQENGYWEFEVAIPTEATGRLFLDLQIEGDDDFNRLISLPIQTP